MADAGLVSSIFMQPILTNFILPFLLAFVIVFAILEKTNLLGEGKRNANLLVAFVIGILFIGAQSLVGFTIRLIPIVTVFLIVLLGYFLIFGFIGIHLLKGMKITLGIVFGIAFIVAVAWATGLLSQMTSSVPLADVIGIILVIALMGGAIALVIPKKMKEGVE